jgi:putative Mg2+ transporter-C (MgtC) family protein
MPILEVDLAHILTLFARIGAAFLFSLPLAWERERHSRLIGLRTFPVVAVASCGYVLIAAPIVSGTPDAQARIIQGLMTGIGFIGGGAILKEGANVTGTATAASVWAIGAVGAAAGFGRYEVALVIALVSFGVLRFMEHLKDRTGGDGD